MPRGEANRLAVVEVARDDDRVHVRRATDRRRVPELRGDEPHRRRDVALRLRRRRPPARARRARSRRAACRPTCGNPSRCNGTPSVSCRYVVDVARGEVVPRALVAVAKEPRARRTRAVACTSRASSRFGDDLPLLDRRLPTYAKTARPSTISTCRLRSVVMPNVPFSSAYRSPPTRKKLSLMRRTHGRGHARRACDSRAAASRRTRRADAGSSFASCAHAVVLAELPALDRALVVAVLLAPLRVEAPRLDPARALAAMCTSRPRGRDAQRADALERARVAHERRPSRDVAEAASSEPSREIHSAMAARREGKRRSVACRLPCSAPHLSPPSRPWPTSSSPSTSPTGSPRSRSTGRTS